MRPSRRRNRSSRAALGLLWLTWVLALGACADLKSQRKTEYVTVEADTRVNTPEANHKVRRAVKLLDKGHTCSVRELEKIETLLKEALADDVHHGPAHNNLGHVYFLQGRYYLAAWEYEFAHKAMPAALEPLYNLGLLYETIDQLERAAYYYEQAHHSHPTNPAPIGNLARVLLKREEPLDVVRPLLESLLLYDSRPAWTLWARDLLGRHPQPLATYTEAAGASPSLPAETLPPGTPLPLPYDAGPELMHPRAGTSAGDLEDVPEAILPYPE